MTGTPFEDFLRWNNNSNRRPLCIIIKANETRNPLNNLNYVLYNIAPDGHLQDIFPDKIQSYTVSLFGC